MINNSREKDIRAKQENDSNDIKLSKSTTSSTSRQWAGFKNPRIVRVSRSFGGKDRHSKVCTIRGLRDRRIRLSVPSAIMLYDLQDKLGLNQPSKVVDWLLDATKHEIDKLPPLQIPPEEYFSQFHQQTLVPHNLNAPQSSLSPFCNTNQDFTKDGGIQLFSKGGISINDRDGDHDQTLAGKSKYWTNSYPDARAKCKEVEREDIVDNKWNITRFTTNEQENQGGNNGGYIPQLSAQNFFPLANQFSFPSLLNNWEPSNLSLSQFGSQAFPSQSDSRSTTHSSSLPPSMALPSTSQLFFCPPTTTPSFFPQYPPFVTPSVENDPRHINHFQFLSSSSQHMVPNSLVSPLHFISPLNVNPKVNSQNSNDTTK